jgi:hypothetical protein
MKFILGIMYYVFPITLYSNFFTEFFYGLDIESLLDVYLGAAEVAQVVERLLNKHEAKFKPHHHQKHIYLV